MYLNSVRFFCKTKRMTTEFETDSTRKAARISQHTPSPPHLFTRPGVAFNTWQTPKSQRCRKLLCQVEHVIHLFSHTCLSFGSFVALTLCLFALCHFLCQHKLIFLYYSNKVRGCGLDRSGEGFGSSRFMVHHNGWYEIC